MNRRSNWNALETEAARAAWLAGMSEAEQRAAWLRCRASAAYFIDCYCQIYDKAAQRWTPFTLWPEQYRVLRGLGPQAKTIVLKARQLGLSWLALAYHGLWRTLFQPIAKVGIFSKRDDEAVYLLGDERLKGMYERLPGFLQCESVTKSDAHIFAFSNGSVVRAYPTSAGDSYALTDVILDEFDLVPDQNRLMRSVKPTVDTGAMTIISRADKSRPLTEFKRLYRAARAGSNGWTAVFLPWSAHPVRDAQWYEAMRQEIVERTGSADELFEQYPATDEEALAPRSLDKRILADWIRQCYRQVAPVDERLCPAIPGLHVYALPQAGRLYVLAADPAEGNPTSDDSALDVIDAASGEQAATLAGKFEPDVFGGHIAELARWYNGARALVERNNHGHAVLLWLRDNAQIELVNGKDDRPGWLNNSLGKSLMYDACANALRDGDAVVHSAETYAQLTGIEGSSLSAPEGEHDDRATAFALAMLARGLAGPAPVSVNVEIGAAAIRRTRSRMLWQNVPA